MLWERILLLLVHLLVAIESSHPPQPDCYTSYGKRINNETTHYCSLQKSENVVPNISDWNPPKEELKLNLKDSNKGLVTVKFPIPDTLLTFDVVLLINESARTEEECNKSHRDSHREFLTHSQKMMNRKKCNWFNESSTCSSCGTVYVETEMHNVYKGCYILKVRPTLFSDDKMIIKNRYSKSIFINSNYNKTFIQTPKMTYEYSPHRGKVNFQLPLNQSWNKNVRLKMYTLKQKNCYTYTKDVKEIALVVDLSPNITVQQCETNNPNHRHPECDPEGIGLSCRIYNVTPGNYCIRAQVLNDDRCDSSTVWTQQGHSCVWIYNFVAAKGVGSGEVTDISPDSSIFYIYVGLGAAASLAFFAAVIHAVRTSKKHLFPYEGPSKSSCTTRIFPKEKLLLLYACDCSPFMDLMTTFRKILQKVSSWEVYDVFDPYQWSAIAIGRQEWVQRLLSDDDTVIVIIDSTSAVMHQNALENNFSINYFQPRPNSDLFAYALQMITNNVQRNVYKKVFVVRFNGFSEDGQTLRHIAPLRRYLLPDHFHELLSSLKETSFLNLDEGSQDELRDTVELQKCLDNLVFYKSKNPTYLKSVLYRT